MSQTPDTDRQALSKKELTPLAIMAAKAWKAFMAADPEWLPDMLANGHKRGALESDWRHGQCRAATLGHPLGPVASLSGARRGHWNALFSHFAGLAGEDMASFRSSMRDGRAPAGVRAGAEGDSQEKIRQARAVLESTMESTGLRQAYVAAVIKNKFHVSSLDQLTAKQIWQVVFTLRNRAVAKQGGGHAESRNKRQREGVQSTTPF